jgi:hypothetical protein
MMGLFRHRRAEHRHDAEVRQTTAEALTQHRQSLNRVKRSLEQNINESIADEMKRLDRAIEGASHR